MQLYRSISDGRDESAMGKRHGMSALGLFNRQVVSEKLNEVHEENWSPVIGNSMTAASVFCRAEDQFSTSSGLWKWMRIGQC